MNGYNFTERVRKALAMAREEAARLRHEYVGTEHILLGLLREGEGVASTVLENLSIDADALAAAVEAVVKKPSGAGRTGPDLPYTSRAKKTLELAMSEARELNHNYVGTEHLLLGLIREEKGVAAQVLADAGATLDTVRAETVRVLGAAFVDGAEARDPAMRKRFDWLSRGVVGESLPERVRIVMTSARTLAAQRGSAAFEPAHVALALVLHGEGTANAALRQLEFDRERLVASLSALAPDLGTVTPPEGVMERSADLQRALLAAQAEQQSWKAPTLATHHVLIALLASDQKVASVFSEHGVTLERVRDEARRIVG